MFKYNERVLKAKQQFHQQNRKKKEKHQFGCKIDGIANVNAKYEQTLKWLMLMLVLGMVESKPGMSNDNRIKRMKRIEMTAKRVIGI